MNAKPDAKANVFFSLLFCLFVFLIVWVYVHKKIPVWTFPVAEQVCVVEDFVIDKTQQIT